MVGRIERTREIAEIMCSHYFYNFFIYKKNSNIDKDMVIDKSSFSQYYNNVFRKYYYKYFEQVAEIFAFRDSEEGFDGKIFIDMVMKDEYLYPQQLSSEKNWEIYKKYSIAYRESYEEEKEYSEEMKLAMRLKKDCAFLRKRTIKECTKNRLVAIDIIEKFGNERLGMILFVFSNSFMELMKEEKIFVDFSEEQSRIREYPRIYNKVKEILGDDFKEV